MNAEHPQTKAIAEMRRAVSEMSEEHQEAVDLIAHRIRRIVMNTHPAGMIALALVSAELAEAAQGQFPKEP